MAWLRRSSRYVSVTQPSLRSDGTPGRGGPFHSLQKVQPL